MLNNTPKLSIYRNSSLPVMSSKGAIKNTLMLDVIVAIMRANNSLIGLHSTKYNCLNEGLRIQNKIIELAEQC